MCQDSQISKPETPYFPKPPHPYPSLLFAILHDLSRFFAIPRYKDHEPHEPSRPTLFNHFVLLMSFLLSFSSLSDVRGDNETVDDDIWDVTTKSTMLQLNKDMVEILKDGALDIVILGDVGGVVHLIRHP